jgi:hypothetical protein
MVKDRHYTIEFTAQAFLRQGLISREQHKETRSKGNFRKTKLQKSQDSHYSRRHYYAHHITPAEVISSLSIEMSGSSAPRMKRTHPGGAAYLMVKEMRGDLVSEVSADEDRFCFS